MKEATGELNMTVITLIAIGAIGALFYVFVWPMIQRTIAQQTCQTYGSQYVAEQKDNNGTCDKTRCIEVADTGATANNQSDAKVSKWCCCKPQ